MSRHIKHQTSPQRTRLRYVTHLTLTLILALSVKHSLAFETCGALNNGYGPFDYRTHRGKLQIVEAYHFDAGVESLQQGKSGYVGADLDYTLRASPNHPRALMAMVRLSKREKVDKPRGAHYTVDCYFDRAVRFAPDDPTVLTLYAAHLNQKGKKSEAIKQLAAAEKHAGRSPNIAYNMGLVYLDLDDYENALRYAHIAYEGGFPLPGLRNRLKRANKWREMNKQPSTAKGQTTNTTPPADGNN